MFSFDYHRPADVAGAARAGGTADARFLAGGQSLVQAMKLRLAQPAALVDLGTVPGLAGISVQGSTLRIGAMTRHSAVAASADVRRAIPALAALAEGIGDPMVRNAGTLGGSIAHADPAACYPAGMLGLGATVVTDRRSIPGDAFFTGLFETALEPGELVVAVDFAVPARAAYLKFKHPASRFAMVGVFVSQGAGGVRVGVTGVKSAAFRWREAEAALAGGFRPAALDGLELDPSDVNGDMHGSAAYRAALVATLTKRAVEQANAPVAGAPA
ncbi:MAG: FAD binding domain-containing protein [Burkholderiales bacterium]|nr:FAD binding domain-containing protein [Burkholderiales bacterium]